MTVSPPKDAFPAPQPTITKSNPPVVGSPDIKALEDSDYLYIFNTTLKKENRSSHTILAFIREYVQCRDIEVTAREVKISVKEARAIRSRRDVSDCIDKITELQVLKYGIDSDELVKKVHDIAVFDPVLVVDKETGACKTNVHDIPLEARRAIKRMKIKNIWEEDMNGIKTVVGEMVEIEFWDKLKATEMVGREFGKFKETTVVEMGPTKDMKDILLESRKRAERDGIS